MYTDCHKLYHFSDPTCYCPTGLEGNPRVRCEARRIVPKPECEVC